MKYKIGTIELPTIDELAAGLEAPKVTEADDMLDAAKRAADDCRVQLTELTKLCTDLPHLIVSGRAPSSALAKSIDEERGLALTLKARSAEVEAAQTGVESARAESRDRLLAAASELLEHLKKTISPILPALELVQSLEYETERCVDVAFLNPLTGTAHPRKQLPALKWPQCVRDEQTLFSWRESSIARRSADEK